MRPLFRSLTASAFALLLAGCQTSNPTPLDRPGDVPTGFTAPTASGGPIWPDATWWLNFKANELAPLEETAQKENLDLAAAAARVVQAEAADGVAFAGLLPTAGLSGGVSRTRAGSARTGATSETAGTTYNAFNAGLSASYQQNFFGRQFDQLQAARESLRAARYAETVVGLSVEAEVADQYFTVLSLRERIAITNSNIAAAKRILAITQAKVSSGVLSNLELAEQQAVLVQQQSLLPGLIEAEREARYALAILLGRAPEGFDVTAQNLDGVVSPVVQPGLPSDLLLRLPDIAEAEANLFAAHANVDAARAAFFPSLSLTGQGGYTSGAIGNLINPSNFIWSIGASVVQTIFDGGAIKAQSDEARAVQTEMLADYRKTVFSDFGQVESALGTVRSTSDQLTLLDAEVKADAEAFRISELQYREGTIDIVQLLTNQQNLFNAQNAFVQTKLARLEANIGLYTALGGGWTQKADDASYHYQLDWWPL
ncbi:MAG TPA: efflux transporter outer membrane subunit [Rhizomicrobium sp.]|jgi:NodT family efflux transporter outer membrane factor (OMF) lipoprotein|nr:efflux transporter outer membrane subunit [Rhizomicrobium sp.]